MWTENRFEFLFDYLANKTVGLNPKLVKALTRGKTSDSSRYCFHTPKSW